MKNMICALASGVIFGAGLALSGMTDTARVQGFLDIFGDWDVSLALVMIGAISVTASGYALLKRAGPQYYAARSGPDNIDKKLVMGAVLFGAGWGLYGYCPAPALVSLAYLEPSALVFVAFMLVGMFMEHLRGQ